MSQYFDIHPDNPQPRLLKKVVDIIRAGGVVIYPTDSVYAVGCQISNKRGMERMRALRELDKDHNFTLLCRDISEIAIYAKVNNSNFRLLKANTPGPLTFLLAASSELPRRLLHSKRKTVGVRVPNNAVVQALLSTLDEPLMSMTFALPDDEFGLSDPFEIKQRMSAHVDAIVDAGYCGIEPTTIVDLTDAAPRLVRQGMADFSSLG